MKTRVGFQQPRPEFISVTFGSWAEDSGIKLEFIQSGKPTQNSYVERLNRTYRDEILNMYAFKTLTDVREIADKWICEYNEERPNGLLGDLTPSEHLMANNAPGNSNLA